MSNWDERTLRGAASWKAFKDGKSLCEARAVSDAKAGSGSWQGSVKESGRTYKVAVKVISATNLETRCGCPENRSSGALCAHAVAAGLAALARKTAPGEDGPRETPAATPAPPIAWEIQFPPNWMESVHRGRLAATLRQIAQPVDPSDLRLGRWLAAAGQVPKDLLNLHLDSGQTASFLGMLAEHPRVVVGKERVHLDVRSGGRLALRDVGREGTKVRMVSGGEALLAVAGSWWSSADGGLSRIGEGSMPESFSEIFIRLASGQPVELPVSRFLEEVGEWQKWLSLPPVAWLEQLHFIPAKPVFSLALDGSLQTLEARLRVRYGDSAPVLPGAGKVAGMPRLEGDRCETRNLPAEVAAVGRLVAAGFAGDDLGRWTLRGEERVVQFLTRVLPALRGEWSIHEGERFASVRKQVVVVSPKIEILGSGEDWLSFNLSFKSENGVVIPANEIRKLLSAGGGKIAGGKRIVISEEVAGLIEPMFSDLDLRQEGGHYLAGKRDREVIQELRDKLAGVPDDKENLSKFTISMPPTIVATLRPYQTQGAAWLVDRSSRFGGALLADDMGLGKTLQTIVCIERFFVNNPDGVTLVIATASLLGNWRAEFGKFAPARQVRILHGAGRDAERAKVAPGEVILTSFGTISRDLAWYLNRSFLAVVVDEASLMRNPDTDHAKAISKLVAENRIALTGTPIENGVRDLWSIFRFIQPGWLGTREVFKERYEQAVASGEGSGQALARLRFKTAPFLLRRTKEQVAPDLPSKIYIDEFCDLSSDQQGVYRELLTEGRKRVDEARESGGGAARMRILTALLRLRQTCCDLALLGNERLSELPVAKRSAKLARLLELIEEAVSGGHRMLVFSQFQSQLREIEKHLLLDGHGYVKLDGATRDRQTLVDRFQRPDGPPIFLISLKAGGYGLNLTAADIVVHFDPWWNPAAVAQATDRAHRIGQTRPVTVYHLLTRGTVEEKVVRLQDRKRKLSGAIEADGDEDGAGITEAELMDLME